jgi:hypothetical protein
VTKFVDIVVRRCDRVTEALLLRDLQAVCQVVERRVFQLTFECRTDNAKKITKILAKYEKEGYDLKLDRDDTITVYIISPWRGHSRSLVLAGGYQLRIKGKILNYATKKDVLADAPVFEKETFDHWEKVKT